MDEPITSGTVTPLTAVTTPTPGAGDKVTFTSEQQEVLNKMFGERAAQGRAAGQAELLKELGVATADEVKAALAQFKQLQDSQKTELEKAQAVAQAEAQQRAQVAEKLAALETEHQALKLRAALQKKVRADKIEFVNAQAEEDAFDFILRAVTFNDKAELVGLDDALKSLKTERDYLLNKTPAGSGIGTPRPSPGTRSPSPQATTKIGVRL